MLIRTIQRHEIESARLLLAANGWSRKVSDAALFCTLVERSQIAVVAMADGQVVGFIRALTDGIFNGYISMVVVAKDWQGRGVGSALVKHVLGSNRDITWVLRADRDHVAGFYEKLGFDRSSVAMERGRY